MGVYEVNTEGLKRPLSVWQVSPQELRGKWQNGLITTGYVLVLPWKVWPSTEKLRVVARFQLVDGRTFEADKDVTVHVLPEKARKSTPPAAPATPVPGAPFMPPAPAETRSPPEAIPFMPKPNPEPKPAPDPPPSSDAPPAPKDAPPAPKDAPRPLPAPLPEPEGPRLSSGRQKVELLRPVALPPED